MPTVIHSNMQSLAGFSMIQKCVTLNDLYRRCNAFCAGFGARCVRVDKLAVFSVHKRSIIELL